MELNNIAIKHSTLDPTHKYWEKTATQYAYLASFVGNAGRIAFIFFVLLEVQAQADEDESVEAKAEESDESPVMPDSK